MQPLVDVEHSRNILKIGRHRRIVQRVGQSNQVRPIVLGTVGLLKIGILVIGWGSPLILEVTLVAGHIVIAHLIEVTVWIERPVLSCQFGIERLGTGVGSIHPWAAGLREISPVDSELYGDAVGRLDA